MNEIQTFSFENESKKAPHKNAVLTVEDGFVTINGMH